MIQYIIEQIEDKYDTYLSEDEVALVYETLNAIEESKLSALNVMKNSILNIFKNDRRLTPDLIDKVKSAKNTHKLHEILDDLDVKDKFYILTNGGMYTRSQSPAKGPHVKMSDAEYIRNLRHMISRN